VSPKDVNWWFAPARRIPMVAIAIIAFDQLTKSLVARSLEFPSERVWLEGFFKLVHWGNTGSAFSMFQGANGILALVSIAAIVILYLTRHHFDADTTTGQIALGLIFGGIVGNLLDRMIHGHVIDFIYFYVVRSDGTELGFPAFNIADSAICVGVGLLFVLAWLQPAPDTAKQPAG
jgi:signal peptidase II